MRRNRCNQSQTTLPRTSRRLPDERFRLDSGTMAKKTGNGHVGDLNSTILRSIEEKIEQGFGSVNERLDRVVENTGKHWRAHEEVLRTYETRLKAIEQKLGIAH